MYTYEDQIDEESKIKNDDEYSGQQNVWFE